jgi:hypothetical protein
MILSPVCPLRGLVLRGSASVANHTHNLSEPLHKVKMFFATARLFHRCPSWWALTLTACLALLPLARGRATLQVVAR